MDVIERKRFFYIAEKWDVKLAAAIKSITIFLMNGNINLHFFFLNNKTLIERCRFGLNF